jgi:hypothetical protein
MLEACIVVASLVGILNTEPSDKVALYKADCEHSTKFFIVDNKPNTIREVDIIKINNDLSYTIKLKG